MMTDRAVAVTLHASFGAKQLAARNIAGQFRWHTPRSESYSFAPPQMGEISFAATDWDVNKAGKDLT